MREADTSARLLVSDEIGLIKVLHTLNAACDAPSLVTKWGEPSKEKAVVCMAHPIRTLHGSVLAVARQSNLIEVLSSRHGKPHVSFRLDTGTEAAQGPLARSRCVYLSWHTPRANPDARSMLPLIAATRNGMVVVSEVEKRNETWSHRSMSSFSAISSGASMSDSAFLECAELSPSADTILLGGKGVDLSLWDIERRQCTWKAKNARPNALGLMPDKWSTALSHVGSMVAVGSVDHRVYLYCPAQQRRPVAVMEYGDSPIKTLVTGGKDPSDESSVICGCGDGTIALLDVRQGKLLGKFTGGSGGSVRSLARHPHLPILAACGLDRYLRVFNIGDRSLIGKVFVKQVATCVTFDCATASEGLEGRLTPENGNGNGTAVLEEEEEEEGVLKGELAQTDSISKSVSERGVAAPVQEHDRNADKCAGDEGVTEGGMKGEGKEGVAAGDGDAADGVVDHETVSEEPQTSNRGKQSRPDEPKLDEGRGSGAPTVRRKKEARGQEKIERRPGGTRRSQKRVKSA